MLPKIIVIFSLMGFSFSDRIEDCADVVKNEGRLVLKSIKPMEGLFLEITLESPAYSLKTNFGIATSNNQTNFLVVNKTFSHQPEDNPLVVKYFIKHHGTIPPKIHAITLNTRVICRGKYNINQRPIRSPNNDDLFKAAKSGDVTKLNNVLSWSVSAVTETESNGRTALIHAAMYNQSKAITLLLSKGANIEAKDKNGKTALIYAVEKGLRTIVELLLVKGALIETKDNLQQNALIWASSKGHSGIVQTLLGNGAYIEATEENLKTALICAAENGHNDVINILLAKGAKIEAVDGEQATPLLWAAWNGHQHTVQLLLLRGANKEARDEEEQTSLIYGAEGGHTSTVALLLANGVFVDATDSVGNTALHWACKNGYPEITKLLLAKGANIEARHKYCRTPLIFASQKGNNDVINVLLLNGAKLEGTDHENVTPLLWAVWEGHVDTVQLLLSKGANIEFGDEDGLTPLIYAAQQGRMSIVKLLLSKGVDIEGKDYAGNTGLVWALAKGKKDVSDLLLSNGAYFDAGAVLKPGVTKNRLFQCEACVKRSCVNGEQTPGQQGSTMLKSNNEIGFYWRNYHGDLPKDALPGGKRKNGENIYIGQTLHPSSNFLPGTIKPHERKIFYEFGGKEYSTTLDVMVLCTNQPRNYKWVQVSKHTLVEQVTKNNSNFITYGLIPAGRDGNGRLIVGRIKTDDDESEIGKVLVVNNTFGEISSGQGLVRKDYQVLLYVPQSMNNDMEDIAKNIGTISENLICPRPLIITMYL